MTRQPNTLARSVMSAVDPDAVFKGLLLKASQNVPLDQQQIDAKRASHLQHVEESRLANERIERMREMENMEMNKPIYDGMSQEAKQDIVDDSRDIARDFRSLMPVEVPQDTTGNVNNAVPTPSDMLPRMEAVLGVEGPAETPTPIVEEPVQSGQGGGDMGIGGLLQGLMGIFGGRG